jgi:phosphoketolase
MGANPHADGGLLLRDLRLPDFHSYAVEVPRPGQVVAEATRVMGQLLRDVMRLSADARKFRLFGPDETASNRYPWLIHRLAYRRTNHGNLHVRGYKEEGTTTTPFDMATRNDIDRFHLAGDVIDRVAKLGYMAAYAQQAVRDRLIEHKRYITRYGEDMPELRDWRWSY